MLQEALCNLLEKKEFADISISDIAHESGLNRATFYLHYADKYALLQAMTGERFKALLDKRGIEFSCDGALRAIALGVCDYLTETTGCPSQLATMPLETSIVPVVQAMLMQGFEKHEPAPGTPIELIASTAAWAIYGAARQWFETPNRVPAEEIAGRIEKLVKPVLSS